MKILSSIAIAFVSILGANAQDLNPTDVPQPIRTSFEKNNPQATDTEWEMDGVNYKVEFDIKRKEHEIWYSAAGAVVKSEKELAKNELPQAIVSSIDAKYSGYKFDDAKLITQSGKTTYEVEMDHRKGDKIVIFNEDGSVINEIMD